MQDKGRVMKRSKNVCGNVLCLKFLTSEPNWSGVTVLEGDSIWVLFYVNGVIDHPDGGEDEEEDEESLQIWEADAVCGAATDHRTAQHQNVQTDDPGQHPSPGPAVLRHHLSGDVRPLFVPALRSTRRGDVGKARRLRLFGCHLAGVAQAAVGRTVTGTLGVVVAHVSSPNKWTVDGIWKHL